jgi:hypothetical protein
MDTRRQRHQTRPGGEMRGRGLQSAVLLASQRKKAQACDCDCDRDSGCGCRDASNAAREKKKRKQDRTGLDRSGQVRSGLARGWYGRARQVQVGAAAARQGKTRQDKAGQGKTRWRGVQERVDGRPGQVGILVMWMISAPTGRRQPCARYKCEQQSMCSSVIRRRSPPIQSDSEIYLEWQTWGW